MRTTTALMLAMVLAASPDVSAQNVAPGGNRRAELERRFRERVGEVVQRQLGLSDDQARKLGAVNQRHEEQRRLLLEQERDVRVGIRQEMLSGEKANQQRVADLIDRMLKVQRQRLDVVEREQKDLAEFLTPMQRARYMAVQEQVRKRMEEFRRRRGGGAGLGPAGFRQDGRFRPRP